ncbi:SUMF1/EgtB/PvdO family nonheme iron enzyme [Pseudoalteromonas sp. SR41-8]|uniref:SUMF1/EgtB/PvdO family nonheme iron enzyme n=1 Tax=Pseudoalteromonas sp. SR41-8 TaxID=2760946 RepID=UPI001601CBEF|nr:SUMF1/EgtB/PvdO family nonheme iron enzyme [Pseudoalteromonas sp. SR41-8]MBB1310471.1 SUMF1/EgtB/PvdO family nonheme iron enzyme [Pseudoalteromonas sp. SR41-8]
MKLNHYLLTFCCAIGSAHLHADEFANAGGHATTKPIEPIMATIPAGSFAMGSTKKESTQPVTNVNVKEFSLGKYEVTVSEFRRFIAATNYAAPKECRHEMNGWFLQYSKGNWETNALNTSEFQPVVCINWQAAQAYTKWLAKETGKPYRLPTEAEWEYAARAGTKTDYYFGDDPDNTQVCNYANVGDLYGESILQRDSNTSYYNWSGDIAHCNDHSAYASIVGMYEPNAFGLFDVLSNVQEFLADCYVRGYKHIANDGSAYVSDECELRAARGGSWHWSHSPLFSRGAIPEDFAGGVDGFRLALDGAAPKLAKSSQKFQRELIFAQQQEQKRRDNQPAIPAQVTNVVLTQTDDSVTLTWDKSEDSDVDSYRVYRNLLSGGMFKLLASNLTQTTFTDKNIGQHKYDYTVVAVKQHLQSHYSKPITIEPGWISVPGKVEAEWTVEFSDSVISFSSDGERFGSVLTGPDAIGKNAVITYQLNVAKAGFYQLEYRVAAERDTKGFDVYSNEKKLAENPVLKTGGYDKWQIQQGSLVKLKQGKNTLTLKSRDNNWKLNWLSLKAS